MAQKHKITLLDFDEIQANAIKDFLMNLGDFDANFSNSHDFIANIEINSFKLELIVQNFTENGAFLNPNKSSIPILLVEKKGASPKFEYNERIKPPFRLHQLEAKIRSILRQIEIYSLENVAIFENKYHAARRALIAPNGEELKLTDKEIEILAYLNKARPNCVPRDELLREVWRYNEGVTTHTLETHIYRLRQKLNAFLGGREALITDDGGYRLAG